MAIDLAEVLARTSTSITLRVIPSDQLTPATLSNPQAISQLALNAKKMAGLESFEERNDRRAEPRYQIDADLPGEIVERIPQLVDRTLRLRRVVLYESDMLEEIGITGGDLIGQTKPFALVKIEKVPKNLAAANPLAKERVTIYLGCWFTSNPKTYDLGRDIRVVQDCDVAYTSRVTV